ncbi:Fe-S cluster assembly protein SufD [Fontivita pretiosa]|uniref:Fe-S cluster assembly protein SufD n=1 Tax=Fontivita pretiosa TaxID=2989684 RepID=UPI003D17A108
MLTQEHYVSTFSRVARDVGTGGDGKALPAWFEQLRQRGIDRFSEVGFPSTRLEDWRHTNVAPIARIPFKPAPPNEQASIALIYPYSFGHDAVCQVVFVNGVYSPGLSSLRALPKGLRVASLASLLQTGSRRLESHLGRYADIQANPFVALNTGFIRDGAVVYLENNTTIDRPIHLLFLTTPGGEPIVTHPRVLVVVGQNVDAKIVETYVGVGTGVYFTNAVSEVVLGEHSRLDHCRLQHETLEAFHVSTTQVQVGRSSTFITQSATLGAQLTRNDVNIVLSGEAAEATMNGLVILNGTQHCDNHTLLDHASPNCPSHELYKHVLDGSSTGVFRGKILVRPGAQKTDSKQTSRSLLLSDDAEMNSQPALEIYADDVKCTHGSTTGPVDEEMLFYIRSRGVAQEAARHLLTYAFAADITRRIAVEPVRRYVENYMAAQHGLPQDLRITDLGRHDEEHR